MVRSHNKRLKFQGLNSPISIQDHIHLYTSIGEGNIGEVIAFDLAAHLDGNWVFGKEVFQRTVNKGISVTVFFDIGACILRQKGRTVSLFQISVPFHEVLIADSTIQSCNSGIHRAK